MSVVRCTKENENVEADADRLVQLVSLLKAQNAAIGALAREIQSEVVSPVGNVVSTAWKGAQDAYVQQLGKESSECRKACKQADKNAAKLRTSYEKSMKKGDTTKAAEKLQQLTDEANEYMRTAAVFAEGQSVSACFVCSFARSFAGLLGCWPIRCICTRHVVDASCKNLEPRTS